LACKDRCQIRVAAQLQRCRTWINLRRNQRHKLRRWRNLPRFFRCSNEKIKSSWKDCSHKFQASSSISFGEWKFIEISFCACLSSSLLT
jgi:hypothetical protein